LSREESEANHIGGYVTNAVVGETNTNDDLVYFVKANAHDYGLFDFGIHGGTPIVCWLEG
jgi:hypothetical protein